MMAGRSNSKPNTASLLLQPPNSGFSWDQMLAENNVLMPVSPPSSQVEIEDGAEPDSFIGQQPSPQQGFPQGPSTRAQNYPPTTFSQLQQPLRPVQNKTPPPKSIVHPQTTTAFAPPTTSTTYQAPASAPPIGPALNFRRQYGYVPPSYGPSKGNVFQPGSGGQNFQPVADIPQEFAAQEIQQPYGGVPPPPTAAEIKPVQPHWFYKKEVEKREVWFPFTMLDSLNLEEAVKSNPGAVVTTDGGRYDIRLAERLRFSVYWEEEPMPVKRATWFYRAEGQNRFIPYDEDLADMIEAHYTDVVLHGRWHHKLELPGNEGIVVQSSTVILHFLPSNQPDEWGNVVDGQMRPKVVKRGIAEVTAIEHGETLNIDHLVFFVHGVGAICDLKFRSVFECVDDLRSIGLGLLQSHFKGPLEAGRIGRVEFLPVSWHSKLHSDATGIDCHLQTITLSSIPKLRNFTNDTLLDILFYTSPVYCQTIVDTVASEINRMYELFLSRNPNFGGKVSVVGHSLGSLILFDILAHQCSPDRAPSPEVAKDPSPLPPEFKESEDPATDDEKTEPTIEDIFHGLGLEDYVENFQEEKIDLETLKFCSESDIKEMGLPMGPRKKLLAYLKEHEEQQQKLKAAAEQQQISSTLSKKIAQESRSSEQLVCRSDSVASVSYRMGMAGTGQPSVVYPKLSFSPICFFALGSPIAMFMTVRGIQTIGEDYQLPTCPSFFNIFHPFDPVAYRIETLIDPQLNIKPVLIPHHKGRKRMHLELKDGLARMGMDLKQKLMDSLRYTWNSISEFARAHRASPEVVEEAMDRMVQEELSKAENRDETESTVSEAYSPEDIQIGRLNGGRRIDYVLQEKPIESFNEYLFALASHACYWESEDTALLILKEVYAVDGIYPQVLSANKVHLYNPAINRGTPSMGGMQIDGPGVTHNFAAVPPLELPLHATSDPRPPVSVPPPPTQPLGPPPLSGFVRSTPIIKR